MAEYTIHTTDTAPEAAQPTLKAAKAAYGFLPNLLGVLAESPAAVEAYVTLSGLFDKTSLTPAERQVVLLAVSAENECEYCVAAHTGAGKAAGLSAGSLDALRAGGALPEAKLDALAAFTRAVVESRGHVGEDHLQTFYDAGYGPAHVFDVILGVGFKTISNYASHVADIPLDAAFKPNAWAKAA